MNDPALVLPSEAASASGHKELSPEIYNQRYEEDWIPKIGLVLRHTWDLRTGAERMRSLLNIHL